MKKLFIFALIGVISIFFIACGGGNGPLGVKSATATYATTLTNSGNIAGNISLKNNVKEAAQKAYPGYSSSSNFTSFNFAVDANNCKIIGQNCSFNSSSLTITFDLSVEGAGCSNLKNISFNGNYETNQTIQGTAINTTNSIHYNIPVIIKTTKQNSTIKDINVTYKESDYTNSIFSDIYTVTAPIGTNVLVDINSTDANISPKGAQTIGSNMLDLNITYPLTSVGKYITIDVNSSDKNISKKVLLSGLGIDSTTYTCLGGSSGNKCKAVIHLSIKDTNSSLTNVYIDDFAYEGECGIYPSTKDLYTGSDGNVSVDVAVNSGKSCTVTWNGKIK